MKEMKAEYFFPLFLIALDVGAASVYFFSGDYKKQYIGCGSSPQCMCNFLGGCYE